MIFGKHINRYYLKYSWILLIGLAALVLVDYFQLEVPELYRMVINGMNTGFVEIDGELAHLLLRFGGQGGNGHPQPHVRSLQGSFAAVLSGQ